MRDHFLYRFLSHCLWRHLCFTGVVQCETSWWQISETKGNVAMFVFQIYLVARRSFIDTDGRNHRYIFAILCFWCPKCHIRCWHHIKRDWLVIEILILFCYNSNTNSNIGYTFMFGKYFCRPLCIVYIVVLVFHLRCTLNCWQTNWSTQVCNTSYPANSLFCCTTKISGIINTYHRYISFLLFLIFYYMLVCNSEII